MSTSVQSILKYFSCSKLICKHLVHIRFVPLASFIISISYCFVISISSNSSTIDLSKDSLLKSVRLSSKRCLQFNVAPTSMQSVWFILAILFILEHLLLRLSINIFSGVYFLHLDNGSMFVNLSRQLSGINLVI